MSGFIATPRELTSQAVPQRIPDAAEALPDRGSGNLGVFIGMPITPQAIREQLHVRIGQLPQTLL
jgi:hypothetical protein